ncbi:2,4-dienoyl-CoA reductase-like NADH-dependent reductase (Old Yellow Enzyme family) [Vibrio diazotrophicus]|uniref:2,4-dienoyl-CoA reductase-like NADH-dependent reductase (Old Yellow Enzyme family) n=1 Tax=Vibrio diazotrophicus TaxID=685 RepID=A0A329E6I5_VIBDI|nr:alkene reductase [Vibrio diazotrophicus]RAS60997.1 2,4-dienoyl-CoA reductase-like NADH-dependent reductase (Old Yellow Enzyme family) [Vibrio diazotrophicus]
MTATLFESYKLNDKITLKNRIAMAPLTRCMADANLVPTDAMVEYYAKRADAGLIISEATIIRPDGQGYPNTPGLYTEAQIAGWKKVTDAVHVNGGKIFAQLWHTGRVAHPHFWGGEYVLAPSAVAFDGTVPRMRELVYTVPKEATSEEIAQLVEDYAKAAQNAIEAGFDGVEIHGANGYLIDQFLHYDTNHRSDEFGQTAENMSRFPLAVIDAVIARIGAELTGLRVSPAGYAHMATDARDRQVFDYFLKEVENRDLAYLHEGMFDDSMEFDFLGGKVSEYMRKAYSKTLMAVGGYNAETGAEAIKANKFDLLAIGRPFIANPDYVSRVQQNKELVEYDAAMLETLV